MRPACATKHSAVPSVSTLSALSAIPTLSAIPANMCAALQFLRCAMRNAPTSGPLFDRQLIQFQRQSIKFKQQPVELQQQFIPNNATQQLKKGRCRYV